MSYFIPSTPLCLASPLSTSSDSLSTTPSSDDSVDEPPDNYHRRDQSPYSPLFLSPYLSPRLLGVLTSVPLKRPKPAIPSVQPILCKQDISVTLTSLGRRTVPKTPKSVRFRGADDVFSYPVKSDRDDYGEVAATVWMTWSGEVYDRTPIEPSECLDMPKREEEQCQWIKAFQRDVNKRSFNPRKLTVEDVPLSARCRFLAAASVAKEYVGRKGRNESEKSNKIQMHTEENNPGSPTVEEYDLQSSLDEAVQEDNNEEDVEVVEDDSEGSDQDEKTSELSSPASRSQSHKNNVSKTTDSKDCKGRKARFGMCGMGKWTRNEVYSSCDALGGF